jgi:hypothetical protein
MFGLHWQNIISPNASGNNNSCTDLDSLSSLATNRIGSICSCTAQGAKESKAMYAIISILADIKFCQCKLASKYSHSHWFSLKLFVCENSSESNCNCTCLGSLGAPATNRINTICCQTAQGAKVSTATIVAITGILTSKKF